MVVSFRPVTLSTATILRHGRVVVDYPGGKHRGGQQVGAAVLARAVEDSRVEDSRVIDGIPAAARAALSPARAR
ncbi:hypothetical protein [Streptomyces sp. NPDC048737]|uniref:hypothetical protein n=1 Tax=unclassified Streptomyces TaxID=2593676 RepID=UPI003415BC0B